jgi:transcriptional regulator with PAS, ATPase and Fis domain
MNFEYLKEIAAAVTVCDRQGVVVWCNDRSLAQFEKYGNPVGRSLKDCHLPASWDKIVHLMDASETNVYTIEKHGDKKVIYQTPWLEDGEVKGLIEISFGLPHDMPHFVRE